MSINLHKYLNQEVQIELRNGEYYVGVVQERLSPYYNFRFKVGDFSKYYNTLGYYNNSCCAEPHDIVSIKPYVDPEVEKAKEAVKNLSEEQIAQLLHSLKKMNWLPIETTPKDRKPFKMFAVIAKDVVVTSSGIPYTTDPYYVWRNNDGTFARWPHPFPPTHWHPMPNFS